MAPRIHLDQHDLPLSGGSPLHYALGVPVHQPGQQLAVVIGLHFGWTGAQSSRMGRDFLRLLVEPGLAELGAILVGPTCPERTWYHPRSERGVLSLLDHVLATTPADPDRVVLAGFSLGGMGAWYLGAHHPQRFSHCVPIATLPVLERGDDGGAGLAEFKRVAAGGEVAWHGGLERVAWTVIHSRADELVPCAPVERAVGQWHGRGVDIRLELLDRVGHYESVRYIETLRANARRIGGRSSGTAGTVPQRVDGPADGG